MVCQAEEKSSSGFARPTSCPLTGHFVSGEYVALALLSPRRAPAGFVARIELDLGGAVGDAFLPYTTRYSLAMMSLENTNSLTFNNSVI